MVLESQVEIDSKLLGICNWSEGEGVLVMAGWESCAQWGQLGWEVDVSLNKGYKQKKTEDLE